MTESHIRVPPDSTGKRVFTNSMVDVNLTSVTRAPITGETVVFSGGLTGIVSQYNTSPSPHFYVEVAHESIDTVTAGETITVNGSTIATVDSPAGGDIFHSQKIVLVSDENSFYGQKVDQYGQAHVRFGEGAPSLDAFGRLEVSQTTKLAEYIMRYDELPNDFTTEIVASATLTHSQDYSGVVLTCTTNATDSIERTSDEYHVYQAGISHLIEMTCACGDTGKANVVREWGYYDDEDGLFFQLSGTTFNVVQRSSTSGSPVDTTIAQTNFNGDTVDGGADENNLSGMSLDLSKDNIYWIDFQWLGAGRARMGCFTEDGQRIVLHTFQNANNKNVSFMKTGTLPIRYKQYNTGTTASTSEFRFFCAVVATEGEFNPFRRAFSYQTTSTVTCSAGAEAPLLAIRPMQNFKAIPNRSVIYPNTFEIMNFGPDPVIFRLVRGGNPAGGTWSSVGSESVAEIYTSATSYSGGSNRKSTLIAAGQAKEIEFKTFEENRRGLRRKGTANASGTAQHVYSVQAIGSAGASSTVYMAINWDEVRG